MTQITGSAGSAPVGGASLKPSSPLERALGITDRHGWLLAWWQALVVGATFVAVSLAASHSPTAHHVRVGVVAGPSQTQALSAALDQTAPGQYRLTSYDLPAAERALNKGHVYGIVELGDAPTLRYAGAQGPTVFAAFVRTLVPAMAGVAHSVPTLVDAKPLRPDDAAGLPLFYLSFAVVLSSYLFAVTTTTQARRLRAWGHWTSAAALAISLGTVAALIARFGTHTVGAHAPTVALVLTLTSLGTGASSYLLLRLSSTFGSVLGTLILVILGSSSGGVVPGEFLPGWLAALRGILPMGVSLITVRDTTYFGGHHVSHGIAILVLWAGLPLLAAGLLARRHTATEPSPAPAG